MNLEDNIIKLRNEGLTYNNISYELGCSKSIISKYCRKNNISNYTGKIKIPDNICLMIQEKYDNGYSLHKLADEFNYSRSVISNHIKNKRTIKGQTSEERKISVSKNVISWRKKIKKKLVDYKGGKCVKCSYDKSIRALQFHHLDPTEKDFTIGGKSYSFEKLKKEVDKCILVCSNCHCEIHDNLLE